MQLSRIRRHHADIFDNLELFLLPQETDVADRHELNI
jgi:hypothetical protein